MMRAGGMQKQVKTTFSADKLTLFSVLLEHVLLAQPSRWCARGLQSARERLDGSDGARVALRGSSRRERVKAVLYGCGV